MIKESDVVSGRLYLNLVEEYKKYDKKQKQRIKELTNRIFELQKTLKYVSRLQKILETKGICRKKRQYQIVRDLINNNLINDDTRTISEISSTETNS